IAVSVVALMPSCRLSVPVCTPRPPPSSPLFPYTTLFRSVTRPDGSEQNGHRAGARPPERNHGPYAAMPLWAGEGRAGAIGHPCRSEEHTSELQSRENLVCRLLLEKKKQNSTRRTHMLQEP